MAGGFHFAEPLWLWALLAPLPLWWLPRLRRAASDRERLARYADRFLLPYLLQGFRAPGTMRRQLLFWSALWALGVVAMAGPRLGYTDVSLFAPTSSLVVVLDLSRSMDVADVRPSRLGRARQEIDDLLESAGRTRVGLIAFASVAHVVAPITEDAATIQHLLPSLSTDLVRWSGSRLAGALERARRLLEAQPGQAANGVVLVSDGDLPEEGLEDHARRLRSAGVTLHVLGVGTPEGGPVPAPEGGWVQAADGSQALSRLEEGRLEALARAGGGLYRRADYREGDTRALLDALAREQEGELGTTGGSQRIWHERFYLPLLLAGAMLIAWFRRTRGFREEAE